MPFTLSHSAPTIRGDAQRAGLWPLVRRAFAILLTLGLLGYGALAIEAGISNLLASENPRTASDRRAVLAAAEHGTGAARDHASVRYPTLSLVARMTSERYVYGKDGLLETLIHYAEMPGLNVKVLVTHNVLAGICMLCGALQFWPTLRRRHPRWHRSLGMTYVVAAQTAMVAAMGYLLLTPVMRIYDHLTFYVMLWSLAIGVSATLWLAMLELWRGNIARHQGWMCLNYGLLLTAPMLRAGWALLGWIRPEVRQIEGNFGINGVLIPASFLCGYGLFVVSRLGQRDRPAPRVPVRATNSAWSAIGLLLVVVAALLIALQFLAAPGIARLSAASALVPDSIRAIDRQVVVENLALRGLFVGAHLAGLLIAARALRRGWHTARQRRVAAPWLQVREAWALAACAAVAGLVGIAWGTQIGARNLRPCRPERPGCSAVCSRWHSARCWALPPRAAGANWPTSGAASSLPAWSRVRASDPGWPWSRRSTSIRHSSQPDTPTVSLPWRSGRCSSYPSCSRSTARLPSASSRTEPAPRPWARGVGCTDGLSGRRARIAPPSPSPDIPSSPCPSIPRRRAPAPRS